MNPTEVYALLKQVDVAHGGNNVQGRFVGTLIVLRESGGDPNKRRDASRNPGGGNDRGLWQINDKYHPDVTDATAFDPRAATEWAYSASNGFISWKPWAGAPLPMIGSPIYRNATKAATANSDTIPANVDSIGFNPFNPLSGVAVAVAGVSAAKSAVGSVLDWTSSLGSLLGNLTSGAWWKRLGIGALGLLIIVFALIAIFGKETAATVGKVPL